MTVLKRIGILSAAVFLMTGMTELSEHLFIQGVPALVSTGEAVVGRPLTPESVAGVARRTARRN